jgi:hypothetical protein
VHGSWGSAAINLTHAHVARERPTAPPAKPKPAPAAPIAKAPSPIGRFLRDYGEIVELCRAQAEKLQISRHETDRLAGLPEGHSGHVLSTRYSKLIGPTYLVPLLEHFGLRLIVIEDPELIARTLARRTPRHEEHVRRPRLLPVPITADPNR